MAWAARWRDRARSWLVAAMRARACSAVRLPAADGAGFAGIRVSSAAGIIPAVRAGKRVASGGVPVDGACWDGDGRVDRLDLAIQRVEEAVDRVIAAWQSEHPDLPLDTPEPSPPAWHPNPCEPPAATIQRAEVACWRASALRQHSCQVLEEAALVAQAIQELHAFLQRPPVEGDPATVTRVSAAILVPPPRPHR